MRIEHVFSSKPKTLGGQRGYDMMRQILDNLDVCERKGLKVDTIVVSGELNDYLQKAWLEMAPENTPMPQHVGAAQLKAASTPGKAYVFLRDFFPYEKRRALARGDVLYGEGKKSIVATGEF
jgi:hypothetical protein